MKLTLVKQLNNTFKIAYNSDYEKAKKLKVNEEYQCEIKQPRNYKFLKKFFALINLVFENQERYEVMDDLRYDLIVEAGYFTRRTNLEGDEIKKAKSISFAKMDETEFNELYDAILRVVVKCFGFEATEVEENILQYY